MKSGFVAIVGRPNVGKSTLVNALVGDKVVITSSRPQTTRNTIRGVVTLEDHDAQLVLVDTPGIHRPRNALGERLNELVTGSIAEADVVVFMLDATQKIGPGDRMIAERLSATSTPVVLVVNKTDRARPDDILMQLATASDWGFAAYVPLSALEGDGLEPLVQEVVALLSEGPAFFPPGMRTDQPDAFVAAELIREKYLERLRDELPHSLAVVVGDIETRDNGTVYVPATIYVERPSQKGIVIGKDGAVLRAVGAEARADLERFFAAPVYLDLRVRVERDWQRREQLLDRLGF